MKAAEIDLAGVYVAKVSNKLTEVRVDVIEPTYDGKTRYHVTNLKTGRTTTFRSAAKFRRKIR